VQGKIVYRLIVAVLCRLTIRFRQYSDAMTTRSTCHRYYFGVVYCVAIQHSSCIHQSISKSNSALIWRLL